MKENPLETLNVPRPVWEYFTKLSKIAKRAKAGTAVASFTGCRGIDGGDCHLVYIAPGADKFGALKLIVDSMAEKE